jgi:hypothetical protein
MENLRVNYQLLASTEATLSGLVSEFENLQAVQDDFEGAMGSAAVASAMSTFAGNWTHHRERLMSSMQSLAAMARETVQQFREADTQLANELTKSSLRAR